MKNTYKFWSKMSYTSINDLDNEDNLDDYENIIHYLSPEYKMLDFGCGNGVTDIRLSRFVKEIHGIDTSSGMIESANKNLEYKKATNCKFICSDLSSDMFTNNYNIVLTMSVLQYIENMEDTVQRVSEILLPEGYYISTAAYICEKKSLTVKVIQFISKLGLIPDIYPRTVEEVTLMMNKAGLDIVEVKEISPKFSEYLIVARKK